MNTITNPSARQYYIASENDVVLAYGYVDPGQRIDSGAPTFEVFTELSAYNARLAEMGVQPEDLWSGELPEDAAQARLILKARVNALRIMKLLLPVTYLEHPFQTEMQTLLDLAGLITLVRAGMPLPANFTWRAYDNIDVPMGLPELVGFGAAMANYRNGCFKYSWALKAQLDAASDPTTIDITSGWPDNANPFG